MILNCRRVALAYSEEKVIFGLHPGKACGEEGVKCYIDKLAGELADTMQMCGAHSLAEITPDMVRI